MSKTAKSAKSKRRYVKGGYASRGSVTDLKPPPKGVGVGVKTDSSKLSRKQ